jgi:hypothetical protein
MDVMDSLPTEILPSAQEIYDMQIEGQEGFYILEATQRESQVVPSTEEIVVRAQNQTKNNISEGRKDRWGQFLLKGEAQGLNMMREPLWRK